MPRSTDNCLGNFKVIFYRHFNSVKNCLQVDTYFSEI